MNTNCVNVRNGGTYPSTCISVCGHIRHSLIPVALWASSLKGPGNLVKVYGIMNLLKMSGDLKIWWPLHEN